MLNLWVARGSVVMAATLLLEACLVACGSGGTALKTALDIRGSWDEISVAGDTQYPQTLHLTSEDFSSGAVAGTDVATDRSFTVVGTISGADLTLTISGNGYTASSKAKVSGTGLALKMTGTFTDSNQTSGTFTATRTALVRT